MQILAIDDDLINQEFLETIFTCHGWKIDKAVDGNEALLMIKENEYKLIITDLKAEAMSGMDFYKVLARKFPQMKQRVIFTTSNPTRADMEFIEEAGRPCLEKPYRTIEFLRAASQTLEA